MQWERNEERREGPEVCGPSDCRERPPRSRRLWELVLGEPGGQTGKEVLPDVKQAAGSRRCQREHGQCRANVSRP